MRRVAAERGRGLLGDLADDFAHIVGDHRRRCETRGLPALRPAPPPQAVRFVRPTRRTR
ncbi:hypothetical protein HDA32_005375 [Spinactinospora alkalitolerans]|uniref:Uncharacterized protein n=1 Tax=Spinactinospora alkalitolerans TaxID=687207 RepID=A0A852U436_9ACTN|nr:hypothetical protein [Spinactinospora alkalitolerans]NYE50255.1 hypothetical protein [Spinactinospora alkalitolerans]